MWGEGGARQQGLAGDGVAQRQWDGWLGGSARWLWGDKPFPQELFLTSSAARHGQICTALDAPSHAAPPEPSSGLFPGAGTAGGVSPDPPSISSPSPLTAPLNTGVGDSPHTGDTMTTLGSGHRSLSSSVLAQPQAQQPPAQFGVCVLPFVLSTHSLDTSGKGRLSQQLPSAEGVLCCLCSEPARTLGRGFSWVPSLSPGLGWL